MVCSRSSSLNQGRGMGVVRLHRAVIRQCSQADTINCQLQGVQEHGAHLSLLASGHYARLDRALEQPGPLFAVVLHKHGQVGCLLVPSICLASVARGA